MLPCELALVSYQSVECTTAFLDSEHDYEHQSNALIYPNFVIPIHSLTSAHSHDISKRLPDLDMLPCLDFELEPFGSFKDKDDRAAELEPAHFDTSRERLSTEEWRCVFVYGFRIVTGWGGTAAEIGAQLLSSEWVDR